MKNVKNEIRFINALQRRDSYQLSLDYSDKLKRLFKKKKDLMHEILVLKSAFSVIDEMFKKEIENAELLRRRWFCSWCCFYRNKITDPDKVNRFLYSLLHPFPKNTDSDMETIDHLYVDIENGVFGTETGKKMRKLLDKTGMEKRKSGLRK